MSRQAFLSLGVWAFGRWIMKSRWYSKIGGFRVANPSLINSLEYFEFSDFRFRILSSWNFDVIPTGSAILRIAFTGVYITVLTRRLASNAPIMVAASPSQPGGYQAHRFVCTSPA
jgi:hypothetical protein